jgi:epoxyqueuosine reductase
LKAKAEVLNWDRKTWNELTEEVFSTIFDSSALKRKGFSGLKQTLELLNKKD